MIKPTSRVKYTACMLVLERGDNVTDGRWLEAVIELTEPIEVFDRCICDLFAHGLDCAHSL